MTNCRPVKLCLYVSSWDLFCVCALQRHCRTFLLHQTYQQRLQHVVVLQAGVRRIIAEKQYRRMKLEV